MGWLAPRDVETLTLPSGLRIRLHRPVGAGEPRPALLWLHGGGYVMGTAKFDDATCRYFVRTLGITAASVDYRLAPEHPYPAALEDAYSALAWLAGLPAVDPARVAVGGDSGGGGLAAALALYTRDRGELDLACQVLNYPMLDDRTVSGRPHPGHRLWTYENNRFGWAAYLGDADPDEAVPARRDDLAGVAPAWIGVGTLDVFCDEAIEYGRRLSLAGVPCQTEVVSGAYHAFDKLVPRSRVARAFLASQTDTLRAALAVD